MARGVLCEGRSLDAARMIEPLIERNGRGDGDGDEGQLMLRCLMARIRMLSYGDSGQVLELLRPYEQSDRRSALPAGLRSEVALWLGWARSWQDDEHYDGARGLNLLDEAERGFRDEVSPSGRCWTLLGQAHAYFTMQEYELMLQALEKASALQEKLPDVGAELWTRHLAAVGARFKGQYPDALQHVEALERLSTEHHDNFSLGRARAHRACVLFELGRGPGTIVDAAEEAENLLLSASSRPGRSLLDAYDAHIGALLRRGSWDAADRVLDGALAQRNTAGLAAEYLSLHKIRLHLFRGELDTARSLLEKVQSGVHRKKRLVLSGLERLSSEVFAAQNQPIAALEAAQNAYRSAQDSGHLGYQLNAILQLAQVQITRGDAGQAGEHMREAEKFADYFSLLPYAARRFEMHGRLAHLQGRPDEARAHAAQASSAYSLIGDIYSLARAQHELAMLNATSSPSDSRALAEAALATFERLNAQPDARRVRKLLRNWPRISGPPLPEREADIGSIVARAASSVELVSEAWLQAAEKLAPERWLVVYRCDEGRKWTRVHGHGDIPPDLRFPDPFADRVCEKGVDWMRLRGTPGPSFFFGMECGGDDDPACSAIEQRLLPWIPVVGLALEHALLRSARLGRAELLNQEEALPLDEFVYSSSSMRDLVRQICRIRSSRSPVLITGETGVGKSLLARAIHKASDHHDAPFIVFACTNVPVEIADKQLFGSPIGPSEGAIYAARGGTLVLDEIADLPWDIQQKLLRFLEDGDAVPLDSTRAFQSDVRILATTSRNIEELIRSGRLREDLYYRINVIPLRIPPLRDRREEIPLLVQHFLKHSSASPNASVTNRALDAMIRYEWPGNVRQLRNEIERLVVLSGSEPTALIDLDDLSEAILGSVNGKMSDASDVLRHIAVSGRGLEDIMSRAEKAVIEEVLSRNEGQVSATADELGLTRQGLYKKMKRLGIETSQYQQSTQAAS